MLKSPEQIKGLQAEHAPENPANDPFVMEALVKDKARATALLANLINSNPTVSRGRTILI
jgi:hypothetical protein